jgi:C4-dicarboxylate transporter
MVLASHETSNLLNETSVVNAFEYLSVLISIILALGVGEMLQARSRRHIAQTVVISFFIFQTLV